MKKFFSLKCKYSGQGMIEYLAAVSTIIIIMATLLLIEMPETLKSTYNGVFSGVSEDFVGP